MKETILAYAAGLFDGEGCVRIRRTRPSGKYRTVRYILHISISMAHEPTIRWLQSELGFNFCVHHSSKENRSVQYIATLHSQKAADFLRLIQPFVMVKANQIELALKFQQDTAAFFKLNARKRLPEEEVSRRHEIYEQISVLNGRTKGRQIFSP